MSISPARFSFRHPRDVFKKTQLTLPYSVDEKLGVCHLMNLCISHTIKAVDAQYGPVTGCCKSIYVVFRAC